MRGAVEYLPGKWADAQAQGEWLTLDSGRLLGLEAPIVLAVHAKASQATKIGGNWRSAQLTPGRIWLKLTVGKSDEAYTAYKRSWSYGLGHGKTYVERR